MIKVTQLTKSYQSLPVLKGVDLEIKKGEIVAITGASGAGKSTLLHLIGTLDNPDSGNIHFLDKEVLKMKKKELAKFRNKNIGFVFQFHHSGIYCLGKCLYSGFYKRNSKEGSRKKSTRTPGNTRFKR